MKKINIENLTAKNLSKLSGESAFEYLSKAIAKEREGKKILHFEIGQPDFPTPMHIKESTSKAINENFTRYVPVKGIPELISEVREEIKRTRNFLPEEDQILILPGAKPGIFFTMMSLINPNDEVIFADPGFPTYSSLANYFGALPKAVALKENSGFRLDPKEVEKKITKKTKLLILNSPQNPTGSIMKKEELQEIVGLAEKHGIFILSDEIYSKMIYDQTFHSPSTLDHAKDRVFIVDGFSKSYSMPGFRLGYLVGPSQIIKKIELLMMNSVSCTTSFVQKAGISALTGSQDELKNMVKVFKERRDHIVAGLNEIKGFSCIKPEGAFYVFPNITKTGKTSKEIAEYLLNEASICVLPGSTFGDFGEGYLRFSYATKLENIDEALKRMRNLFR